MFFTEETTLRRKVQLRQLPPTPETGWTPPAYFPRLDAAKVIGFDCEVKETDFDRGPGWGRGKANVCGISVSAFDGHRTDAWYFPIAHEVEPQFNLDPSRVWAWAKDTLSTAQPKIGANLLYDLGNVADNGVTVGGPLYDVQFAEALLNEAGEVNLEHLGQKYCDEGKETTALYAWMRRAYPETPIKKTRENIYRASPRLVGPYAESDAALPVNILMKQWPGLEKQGLLRVFEMECRLLRLMLEMRRVGVRVDLHGAERMYAEMTPLIEAKRAELHEQSGVWANVNSGADLAKVFDALKLPYPRTEAGAPSFVKDWLKAQEHPAAKLVMGIREMEKLQSTFLKSYLLESHIKGRVHGQFHLLRGDEDGTRSGRLSSSTPNLQNIPSRSSLGKKIRRLFIPDSGHSGWEKGDYSQIEYRYLVHFAVGDGSDAVRAQYNSDPKTDYHKLTQKLVKETAGILIPRNSEESSKGESALGNLTIKEINFGLLYGMGEGKLARTAKLDKATSRKVFDAYHTGNPYVKATMEATAAEVQKLGYITTVLGRRSRFDEWEPDKWGERLMALPYNNAVIAYGSNIRRAHTHKAINRRLQGSAADQIKAGMLACWEAGVYSVTGVPRLTVHDEADFSVPDESPATTEAFVEMRRIMQECIPLRVPVLFDTSRGPNWGECA